MAEQLTRFQSHRFQVLPPDSPPTVERQEGVTMERPASIDAHMETTPAAETREDLSIYNNPLVQLPPTMDTTFHFLMEGQPGSSDWTINHPPDETIEAEYGLNTPFWRTSLGKTISQYKTTIMEPDIFVPLRTRLENAPSNEELLQESIEYTCIYCAHSKELGNAQKSRRRSFSPLPSLSRTTPPGYRALSSPYVAQLSESPTITLVT